jgi:hypothetical protein
MAADALSWPTGADEGKDNNQQITMIPEAAFIRLAGPDSDGSIEHTISIIQNHNHTLMEEWTGIYPIECINNPDESFWRELKVNDSLYHWIKDWNESWWTYGTKDPPMATLDEMKQSDTSTENTSGQVPGHGSWNTSRVAPHVNKTKTWLTASKPHCSRSHQPSTPNHSPTLPWISSPDYPKARDMMPY